MAIREYSECHIPPIVVVGANHKTLSIEGREHLHALGNSVEAVQALARAGRVSSLVVLSTCNRFECVTLAEDAGVSLKAHLIHATGGLLKESDLRVYSGREAITHLFRVTSSLDSMIVGESQILGQVKSAYRTAIQADSVDKILHHLFQYSFRVAKTIRSETAVAEKGVSVSYVAVKLAEQIFDGLTGRKVLLIGSGEMAELALLHLRAYGCQEILIANRTRERAYALAERVDGKVIGLDEVVHYVPQVDVVIGSIHTEKPIIRHAHIRNIRDKSVFFIDCGLPRNFHPDIAELDGIYLYNIDDLQLVARENLELRKEAANDAELIVDLAVYRFEHWLRKVAREPYLLDFRSYVASLCKQELRNGLDQLGAEEAPAVQEQMVERIVERAALGFNRILETLDRPAAFSVLGDPAEVILRED